MRLSERTAWELGENAFTAKVREASSSGRELLDLSVSNPTACGFPYEADALLAPLSEPAALQYVPEPLGMLGGRRAVASYYLDHSAQVPVEHLCLTTSTSEAYSFLFRLLCDPGDEVLVATPSYPLFDFIARLDGVKLVEYPLLYHDGWLIDMHALESAVTSRTRAVIVVHPNNPTGHFCSRAEREALEALCAARCLALVVDEVFLDYALEGVAAQSFVAEASAALTFVLSGISKVCGLPQMKCSWIAASGPQALVEAAMGRLEVIADTFLSMNAPVQHALSVWLAARHSLQSEIRERVSRNLAQLDVALAGTHAQRLRTDAGWTSILRVPRTVDGVDFAEAALARGVLVQPGDFYSLPPSRVVLGLLTPPDVWEEGVARLARLGS